MEQQPLVSVAIATFNRSSLVARAIKSVLCQTVTDLEVLVVDDGSRDVNATADAIADIGDTRVSLLRHASNKGLPAARNTAIRAANGRYIAFLDDDDEWMPTKLEQQLRLLRRYKAVLSASYLRDRGLVKRFDKSFVTSNDLRKGNPFDPSSLIVEAELMKRLLFDETLRVGEDWDAFIRIAEHGVIGYIAAPLIVYTESDPSRMTAEAMHMSVAQLERRMQILHKHAAFFGQFWSKYHTAAFLLSHFRMRRDKFARARYALRRCGVLPVSRLLIERARPLLVNDRASVSCGNE